MSRSLLLGAVKTRSSVPSISVHLHIENTTQYSSEVFEKKHDMECTTLTSGYCTRTVSVFENWMRPDGAVPPPGGSSYFPLFISLASPVPYKNAAVIG